MSDAPLSTPLTLPCGAQLPNRLMKSALSEALATPAQEPGSRLETLYQVWAGGGYGLLVTGNVMVDPLRLGEPGNVAIGESAGLDAFKRWAAAGRDAGTPVWMQINHPGRQANPLASRGDLVAPSAVAMSIPGASTPRALSDTEIDEIIEQFVRAAQVAEASGFDGIQVHGAHGYLVSQFLSPLANRRSDRWGGDIVGRSRFLLEIVRRIRAGVSPGFAIGVKLNSADFQRGGFDEADSTSVVELLSGQAIDLIEISGGSYESPAMMGTGSTRSREAYFLSYAESVRDVSGATPLAVTGGFRSREAMEAAVAEGFCDVVGIGRPAALITDSAARILEGADRLDVAEVALPVAKALKSNSTVRALESALALQWHTDQLHRIGSGRNPDAERSLAKTLVTTVQRNGVDGLRGSTRRTSRPTRTRVVRKFRRERWIGKYFANPAVMVLRQLGVKTHLATTLETTGRRSAQPRQIPVAASIDADGAWIISQHGHRSGWAINIAADPRVRIKDGDEWRSGIAEFRPDDDVHARMNRFAANPVLARLNAAGFRALASDPISVRIRFDDSL